MVRCWFGLQHRPENGAFSKNVDKTPSIDDSSVAADLGGGGGGGGGFDRIPKKLVMGNMGASLVKGVERWAEKDPEEKDAAVRWVGNLCRELLLPRGAAFDDRS